MQNQQSLCKGLDETVAPIDFGSQTTDASSEPQPGSTKKPAPAGSSEARSTARRSSSMLERALTRLGIEPYRQAEFISGFRLYLLFLVVYTVATLGRTTEGVPYGWSNYLNCRFAPENNRFEADGTLLPAFSSVQTLDMLWRYLETTFVAALRPNRSNYSDLGPIGGSTILGAINLHQERVDAIACSADDDDCVPSQLMPLRPDPDPFGPDGVFHSDPDSDTDLNRWLLSPHKHIGAEFTELLTPTPDAVQARLQQLRNQTWIDIGTVSVLLEFTLFNPQIDLICSVRLMFETPAYGGVQAHSSFFVVDITQYSSVGDYILAAFEVAVVVLALALLLRTLKTWWASGVLGIFRDFWLLLDVLNLTGIAVLVGYRVLFAVVVPELLQRTGTQTYVDWQSFAYTAHQLQSFVAVVSLFSWIKMLKYLLLVSPELRTLEQVFVASRSRVFAFTFIFTLVVLGFGQAFFMAFHVEIDAFRSMSHSLLTLFEAMLHGYDMTPIQTQNWLLGPILYVVFVVCASLILLHMFLAIVHATYHHVRGSEGDEQRSRHVSDVIKATMEEVQRRSHATITTPSLRHSMKPGSSPQTPDNQHRLIRHSAAVADDEAVMALPGQVSKSFTDSTSA